MIWRKTRTRLAVSRMGWTRQRGAGKVARMRGLGKHPCDPRDLIHEAFRIEGIGAEACRAIFFDWAMGLEAGTDVVAAAKTLLADLGAAHPGHPMTALLAEAARGMATVRGRSGRRRGRG